MVAAEENFPRGGKKLKVSFDSRKKFDFLGNSDKIGKKKRYKTKVIRDKDEDDLDHLSDASSEPEDGGIKAVSAEKISYKSIQEGMTVLGRIENILDTKLKVTLPGRLSGSVMACHISSSYTKLLQSYVNDEIEDIKKLNDIMKVGEYVSVYVLSVTNKDDKTILSFSMMPQDVNKGINSNHIREGQLIRGAVNSIEDHGYIIDLGIANCRTFLPKKMSEETLNLEIGQVIWCIVKKCQKTSTNSIVTVCNKLETVNSTCISSDKAQNLTVNDLRPGMAVDFFVNKPLKDGAEGLVLSNSVGYVHVSQISSKLRTGKSIKAYLLYTMPLTKLPFFTTREIFKTFTPNLEDEAYYSAGTIINDAKVAKVTLGAIIFKLKHGNGIMPKKLSLAASNMDSIPNLYKRDSTHSVRILNYSASDYAYICSDVPNVLERKYFSFSDLKVGDLVETTIRNVSEKGITVYFDNLTGWIPDTHVSDVGLYQLSKSDNKSIELIHKKFKSEQKITTRVLKVDPSKKMLHLTAKPSLLVPDLVILSKYEDAKVGYQYKGVIVHHLKFGVLVKFFDDVKAIVHRNELSHEKNQNFQDVFYIGQVVNCTILTVNVDEMKMTGSFKSPGKTLDAEEAINKKREKKSKKRKHCDVENTSETALKNENFDESNKSKKKKKGNEIESSKISISQDNDSEDKTSKKNKKQKKNKTESISINDIEEVQNNDKKKKKKKDVTIVTENESLKEESSTEPDKKKSKKKKKSKNNDQTQSSATESSGKNNKNGELTINENKVTKIKQKEVGLNKKSTTEVEFSSMKNFWDLDATSIAKNAAKKSEETSSDSESERIEEQPKKKKKRLNTSEKVEKARQDEEKLRDIERELASADSQPKSSDQFDRLLLANPNNSELWIAYMAFHLQATEIERARAVAKKALSTISFREEQEKLNVWLALLNFENRFGTKESFNANLQEALQMNDTYQIHSRVMDMYVETGKVSETSSLVDTMLAKYKGNPDAYIVAGQACFKLNIVDKARAVMQKAINRLDNKKHVPVLIKFAQMENNNGDTERAETIFEQIVGCLPQRVDVWCVYVDMLMKSKKIDNARLIFERAVSQKLQARKMKILFKKWIEMEENAENIKQVERVRQMATEYVEKIK